MNNQVFSPKYDFNKLIPDRKKAIFIAKRHLDMLVCDAINLEGINLTLPEVQTLLEGITVGGHKISDQTITLNQAKAWKFLLDAINTEKFSLNKQFICELHAIAAFEEAMEWGKFRTGNVKISGTNYIPPDYIELDSLYSKIITTISNITDIYEKAIELFLLLSKNQLFFDVNKRTARFMMNGIIISYGLIPINVPATRKNEFNELMIAYYESNATANLHEFMRSCIIHEYINLYDKHD